MGIRRAAGVGVALTIAIINLAAPDADARRAGEAVDVSKEFHRRDAPYFVPAAVEEWDPASGAGQLRWDRYHLDSSLSFSKVDGHFSRADSNEFPATEYDRDPALPFSVTFVSPRTVRLRFATRQAPLSQGDSLMLAGDLPTDDSWQIDDDAQRTEYRSEGGRVVVRKQPWRVEFYDAQGRLLTRTRTLKQPETYSCPTPFCFVRRPGDLGFAVAASFELSHDEKIFGCGESFTRFDKRGQKVVLYARDGMGVQGDRMYKPVPFFLSSRGYGMFVHSSAPIACDFGQEFDAAATISTGDENLDLFVFLGDPRQVVSEYTALTGRSPALPLWSFGLWMSRITYKSESEVRHVAARLREESIPCDVIHLDTGWFETDWQCNYEFAPSRFDDPAKMIDDLKQQGIRICLWQLPYFTSKNQLFKEIVDRGLAVRNEGGTQPYLDAILDFSNRRTVDWYQRKLTRLLELGVSAIKVDFGEDAPLAGLYASGRTGWYEHNLYPLRYNQTVAEVTKRVTDEPIIWARSAWAGSQRYPLHWGGDAENTDSAMAATLRGGLSLGLCGFTYWSHDVGGFVGRPDPDLYLRWLAFGCLSSHTRCHGAPPREPWEYGEEFQNQFRRIVELKYALMPYVLAQSMLSSNQGAPMVRPLFFEFPDDPASWQIDDEYLFGGDLLVAPLFTLERSRQVYLPPGEWVDYQTGVVRQGGRWEKIDAGPLPIVLLVRAGVAIPHAAIAQSTADVDWRKLELRVYGNSSERAVASVALPGRGVHRVEVEATAEPARLVHDPFAGWVDWQITSVGSHPPAPAEVARTNDAR